MITLMTLYGNKQNRIITKTSNYATFIGPSIILGEVINYIYTS